MDRRLQRKLFRLPRPEPPAVVDVFALRVLPQDHQVNVGRLLVGQRRAHPGIEPGRPHAGILVEPLADLDQRFQGNVVWNAGRVSDRTQQNGIKGPQDLEKVRRHQATVLGPIPAAPIQVRHVEREPACLRLYGL